MKTFSEKLEDLRKEAILEIVKKLKKSKVESKHSSSKCLKIKDDKFMFNLSGGRYLTEIIASYSYCNSIDLIDNEGYNYSSETLTSEDFFEVADYLLK